MNNFRNRALQTEMQMNLILDSEDLSQPIIIRNKIELLLPMLSNQKGEADYNIWYHVKNTLSQNILIVGNDTDIWVYGMALFEGGQLGNKQIRVERVINAEYVDINHIVDACNAHPALSRIPFPANTLATIYLLTGGDYISHFYKTSKLTFVRAFINNFKHTCNDGGLINMTSGDEGQAFDDINSDAWLKLVCTVYLLKHKTLFNSEPIESLHTSLQASQLSPQKQNLLKWLAYSGEESITNLSQWHEFTRRVCFYHSSASKDHEYLLIPSSTALKYHMLRCQYIIKVVYTSMQGQTLSGGIENYGWKDVNGKIQILWENEDFVNMHCTSKGCGCKGGCDGSKVWCKNCYRMCKPCTSKCKCKK